MRKIARLILCCTTRAAISASPPSGPECMQVISAVTPFFSKASFTKEPVVPVHTRWCLDNSSELKTAHSTKSALRLSCATSAIVNLFFIIILFLIEAQDFGYYKFFQNIAANTPAFKGEVQSTFPDRLPLHRSLPGRDNDMPLLATERLLSSAKLQTDYCNRKSRDHWPRALQTPRPRRRANRRVAAFRQSYNWRTMCNSSSPTRVSRRRSISLKSSSIRGRT